MRAVVVGVFGHEVARVEILVDEMVFRVRKRVDVMMR